jgi:hypothetical protein
MTRDPEHWTREALASSSQIHEAAASWTDSLSVDFSKDLREARQSTRLRCSGRRVTGNRQFWSSGTENVGDLAHQLEHAQPTAAAPLRAQESRHGTEIALGRAEGLALQAIARALVTEASALGLRIRAGFLEIASERLCVRTHEALADSRLPLIRGEFAIQAQWDQRRRAVEQFHAFRLEDLRASGEAALKRVAARLAHAEREAPEHLHLFLMPEAVEALLPHLLSHAPSRGAENELRLGWSPAEGRLHHAIDRTGFVLSETPFTFGEQRFWLGAADEPPRPGLHGCYWASGKRSLREFLPEEAAVLASRAHLETSGGQALVVIREGRLFDRGHRARSLAFHCALPEELNPTPCAEWMLLNSGHRLPVLALGPVQRLRCSSPARQSSEMT